MRPSSRKAAGKPMKGVGFEVEEMMKLFLVIIIGLGIVVLIIATSGGIQKLLEDFCAKNPQICGGLTPGGKDNQIAMASTDALVEAINCVAKPAECKKDCTDSDGCRFDPQQYSAEISGNVLAAETSQDGIVVKCIEESAIVCCKNTNFGILIQPEYWMTKDECNKKGSGWKEIIPEDGKCGQYFEEEKPSIWCDVKNFQLPQETSEISEWIKGYGDPKYLVYWQVFPVGEDASWNSKSNWAENVMDIVFVWWGTGKAVTVGKYTINYVRQYRKAWYFSVKDLERELARKEFKALAEQKAPEILKSGGEGLKKILTNRGFQVTSAVSVAAAYIDSISQKYISHPDSIILKSPYFNPEPEQLQLKGEPVILENREISFYLASPCHSDITVRKYVADCDGYSYNLKTNEVMCGKPNLENSGTSVEGSEAECTGSRFVINYFPGQDDFVPLRIDMLNTKEKLKIYDKNTNEISEPVTDTTFRFENSKLRTFKYKTDSGYISFDVVDGKANNGKMEIDFGKAESDGNKYVIDNIDAEILDSSCSYCGELKKRLGNINPIEFSEKTEKIGENTATFYELILSYDEGKYNVMFRDSGSNRDGYADFIGVEDTSWSIASNIYEVPDDVFLKDTDYDGEMDIISADKCSMIVTGVKIERNEGEYEPNFCYADSGTVRTIFRWSPEIGAAAGAVAGLIGGPLSEFTVPGGMAAGYKAGAIVFTAYAVWEKIEGSGAIWPGK